MAMRLDTAAGQGLLGPPARLRGDILGREYIRGRIRVGGEGQSVSTLRGGRVHRMDGYY